MSYDEQLADWIRAALEGVRGVSEKAMFGGIAWMRNGYMFTGTLKNDLAMTLKAKQGLTKLAKGRRA